MIGDARVYTRQMTIFVPFLVLPYPSFQAYEDDSAERRTEVAPAHSGHTQ